MFRLSKGNQSRKNHKIINQTTKVSDTDTKLSTPAIQAQQHQLEEQARLEQERKQLELLEQQKLEKQIEAEKIETCTEEVQKMTINSEENEITKQIITEAINQNVEKELYDLIENTFEPQKLTWIYFCQTNKKVQSDPMVAAMSDMENYIRKMGEYMNYMKELEEKNARLEYENLRYRAENESLKGQLINVTPQFPIQEKIRMQMTNNHQ